MRRLRDMAYIVRLPRPPTQPFRDLHWNWIGRTMQEPPQRHLCFPGRSTTRSKREACSRLYEWGNYLGIVFFFFGNLSTFVEDHRTRVEDACFDSNYEGRCKDVWLQWEGENVKIMFKQSTSILHIEPKLVQFIQFPSEPISHPWSFLCSKRRK